MKYKNGNEVRIGDVVVGGTIKAITKDCRHPDDKNCGCGEVAIVEHTEVITDYNTADELIPVLGV